MPSLDEIGIKNSTDKTSLGHGYLPFYELIFSRYGMMTRILEIGVQFGNSLKTWREYFGIDATILGIDCVDNNIAGLPPTTIWYDDAYTPQIVDSVKKIFQVFNIIIDDGSHLIGHQQFVVANYSKLLTPDGVLIVEDIPGMDAIPRLVGVLPEDFDHAVVNFRAAQRNTHDSILFMLWRK